MKEFVTAAELRRWARLIEEQDLTVIEIGRAEMATQGIVRLFFDGWRRGPLLARLAWWCVGVTVGATCALGAL